MNTKVFKIVISVISCVLLYSCQTGIVRESAVEAPVTPQAEVYCDGTVLGILTTGLFGNNCSFVTEDGGIYGYDDVDIYVNGELWDGVRIPCPADEALVEIYPKATTSINNKSVGESTKLAEMSADFRASRNNMDLAEAASTDALEAKSVKVTNECECTVYTTRFVQNTTYSPSSSPLSPKGALVRLEPGEGAHYDLMGAKWTVNDKGVISGGEEISLTTIPMSTTLLGAFNFGAEITNINEAGTVDVVLSGTTLGGSDVYYFTTDMVGTAPPFDFSEDYKLNPEIDYAGGKDTVSVVVGEDGTIYSAAATYEYDPVYDDEVSKFRYCEQSNADVSPDCEFISFSDSAAQRPKLDIDFTNGYSIVTYNGYSYTGGMFSLSLYKLYVVIGPNGFDEIAMTDESTIGRYVYFDTHYESGNLYLAWVEREFGTWIYSVYVSVIDVASGTVRLKKEIKTIDSDGNEYIVSHPSIVVDQDGKVYVAWSVSYEVYDDDEQLISPPAGTSGVFVAEVTLDYDSGDATAEVIYTLSSEEGVIGWDPLSTSLAVDSVNRLYVVTQMGSAVIQ